MKLLFAEDEVSMAEAVTDILTYHNYTVDTVVVCHAKRKKWETTG